MHKYAIISIRAVECRKVVKNSNLWLASLSQLYIFMQIIIFSWQHSCSDILYFAQYMQSIYCKRGALQHPKHNTTHTAILNAFNPCLLFQSIYLLCKFFFVHIFWCVDYITFKRVSKGEQFHFLFFALWSSMKWQCFSQNVTS